jgi:4-diphosphocytidyl-2-C-methyl-D-erythritol kinase
MKILAPAKINLYLEVKARRPDGYHDIESVMHTVSLYDELTITPQSAGITLVCSRRDLPTDERNLAMRAAVALRKKLGVTAGAKIVLKKNIPLGAGLGGGSSDAAAVLTGLLALWKKRLPAKELNALAAKLGADVPFFLAGGTALASGIGDRIKSLPGVKPASFLLVYPGFGVPTPWVYRHLSFPLTREQKITKIKAQLASGFPPRTWGQLLFNRLEEVVFPAYPGIRHVKSILHDLGCQSLMSGSGSTVYGLIPSEGEGEKLRSKLKRLYKDVWLVQSVL